MRAMLTCFQSNDPAKQKLCSSKTKAMLGQNKSYARAKQKLCSSKTKAIYFFEDVGTRRAALLEGGRSSDY